MTWPRTPRSTWGQLPFCVSCSSLLPPLTELCLFTLGLWNCQLPHLRGAGLPAEDVIPRVAAGVALPWQPPPRLLSRPRRVCGEQLHAECTASVSLETGAGHGHYGLGLGQGGSQPRTRSGPRVLKPSFQHLQTRVLSGRIMLYVLLKSSTC